MAIGCFSDLRKQSLNFSYHGWSEKEVFGEIFDGSKVRPFEENPR